MSGNSDQQQNPLNMALSLPSVNRPVFDPQMFVRQQYLINEARKKLVHLEEQNRAGLENYDTIQRLREDIDRGNRAQQLLNSMGGGQVSTMTNELRPNAAGPSAPVYSYPAATVDADAFGRTRTQQYQQLPYDNSYSAPQARIEEIPSGSSSSFADKQSSPRSSSSTTPYINQASSSRSRDSAYATTQQNMNNYPQVPLRGQAQLGVPISNLDPRQFQALQRSILDQSNQPRYPGQNMFAQRMPYENSLPPVPHHPQQRMERTATAPQWRTSLQPQQQPRQSFPHPLTGLPSPRHPLTIPTNPSASVSPPLPSSRTSTPLSPSQNLETQQSYNTFQSSLAGALGHAGSGPLNTNGGRHTPQSRGEVANAAFSGVATTAARTFTSTTQSTVRSPGEGENTSLGAGGHSNGRNDVERDSSWKRVPINVMHPSGKVTTESSTSLQTGPQNTLTPSATIQPSKLFPVSSRSTSSDNQAQSMRTSAQPEGPIPLPSFAPHLYASPSIPPARVPSGIPNLVDSVNDSVNSRRPASNGVPRTPERQEPRSIPLTPASANKRLLAKSILRALGPPSKRKADEPPSPSLSSPSSDEPPLKRQALEVLVSESNEVVGAKSSTEVAEAIVSSYTLPEHVANLEEPAIQPSTTEREVQDLMEAFAHAVPEPPPVEDSATPSPDSPSVLEEVADVVRSVKETNSETIVQTSGTANPPAGEPVVEMVEESAELDATLFMLEENKTPLFLPSPELLPSAGPSMRIMDLREEMLGSSQDADDELVPGPDPRLHVYVELPSLKRVLQQMQKASSLAKGKGKAVASVPIVTTIEAGEPEQSTTEKIKAVLSEDERRKQLALSAAKVASARLRERPCLWKGCKNVLNTGEKLRRHAVEHANLNAKVTEDSVFFCRWDDCVRRFRKPEVLLQHIQSHVRRHIFCSYQNCDEVFDHPLKLLDHIRVTHMNDGFRPTAHPFVHIPPTSIPPLPTKMYAYHTVELPVRQSQITKDRHDRLGPWVLKRIFGAVNFDYNRPKARSLMRPKDNANKLIDRDYHTSERKDDRRDMFDFLLREPSCQVSCDELDSVRISQLVEKGLPFLPDKNGPQGPLEELILTSIVQSVAKPEQSSIRAARPPSSFRSATPRNPGGDEEPQPQPASASVTGPGRTEAGNPPVGIDAPVPVVGLPQLQPEEQSVNHTSTTVEQYADEEGLTTPQLPSAESDSSVKVTDDTAPEAEVEPPEGLDADAEKLQNAISVGEEKAVEDLV